MIQVQTFRFKDDGGIPNNPELPLLFYEDALEPDQRSSINCRDLFNRNGWGNDWVNGVYDYHHYHSNTHEVLGVISGSATLKLGGPEGRIFQVRAGDVLLIPAGVGHCRMDASGDFRVVGAYPEGRDYDLCRGLPEERPEKTENIRQVPLPEKDPVFGGRGPLKEYWS